MDEHDAGRLMNARPLIRRLTILLTSAVVALAGLYAVWLHDGERHRVPESRQTEPSREPTTEHTEEQSAEAKTFDPESLRQHHYGPRTDYQPVYDILVDVGELSQALLDSHPEGTRFALAAGTHRLRHTLAPRRNQQLLGVPGAVISGAKVLSGWTAQSGRWHVTRQSDDLPSDSELWPNGHRRCFSSHPRCRFREVVTLNGQWLHHAPSLLELSAGEFFFDYDSDRIYIADDPTGKTVEVSRLDRLIAAANAGVVLRNVVIEMSSSAQQQNGVEINGGRAVDNLVRNHHGRGLFVTGTNGVASGNYIHTIGATNVGGQSGNALWEYNRVSHGNHAGFNGWEAGGSKWALASDLTVRRNWFHDHAWNGIWADIDNDNLLIAENLSEDNDTIGIFYEISFAGVIRDNVVLRNGLGRPSTYFSGAGINVTSSTDVEVSGNRLAGNLAGIVARDDGRRMGLASLRVHNNHIVHPEAKALSGITGFAAGVGAFDRVWTLERAHFTNNHYDVVDTGSRHWIWGGSSRAWTEWRDYGHDVTGTVE